MNVFAKSKRALGHYRAGRHWPFEGRWATGVLPEDLVLLRGDAHIILEVAKPLEEMTLEELRSYASAHGIDLGDAKKRDDVLSVIQPLAASGG